MDDPDEVLIERAKTDADAFGELYERYVGRVYNYVYYRVGNVDDAEDLTARVFYQALTHLPKYTYRGLAFSSWLLTISHNQVANWHRDQRRGRIVPLQEAILPAREMPDLEDKEEVAELRKVVATLPAERQHLIMLKFVEELSTAEIARIMGKSEGAVKALLHRTVKSLRDRMGQNHHGDRKDHEGARRG